MVQSNWMKKYSLSHLVIVLLVGLLLGFLLSRVNVGSFTAILPQSCTHKGVAYQDGEGFKDDCNSCSCTNGEVACTAMACAPES